MPNTPGRMIEFRTVCHKHDPVGPAGHRGKHLGRLQQCVGRAVRCQPARPDHRPVAPIAVEKPQCGRACQRALGRMIQTGRDHHRDRRVEGKDRRHPERVGDHGQVGKIHGQTPRDMHGCRPRPDHHMCRSLEHRDSGPRHRFALRDEMRMAFVEARFCRPASHGAPICATDHAGRGQFVKVAPDGFRGHLKMLGKLADPQRVPMIQLREDTALTRGFRTAHTCSLTADGAVARALPVSDTSHS